MIEHLIENNFSKYKKRGNIYRIPCIYHKETEPSLDINLDQNSPFFGVCKCWGCKKTVTVRQFFLDMGWGVDLLPEELKFKKVLPHTHGNKIKINLKAHEELSEYKMFFMKDNSDILEKLFLNYLYKRGFNNSVIKQNLLGYVGASDSRFSNSIIIPYYNQNYDLVYYIGRKISSTNLRYINLDNKENYYGRRDVIFNMFGFLNADTIIICEGSFNAMSWNMLNIPNVQAIATNGTEVSKEQIDLFINNPKKEIVLAFDKDAELGQDKLMTKLIGLGKISKIKFPSQKDANNILQSKEGLNFLKSLWHNRIKAKKHGLGLRVGNIM